jgi:hypothetical protein
MTHVNTQTRFAAGKTHFLKLEKLAILSHFSHNQSKKNLSLPSVKRDLEILIMSYILSKKRDDYLK